MLAFLFHQKFVYYKFHHLIYRHEDVSLRPSARKSIAGFSTKLPVGLFGLIKITNLVLSVIEDKIFSGSNFKSFSFVKS